MANTFYFGDNNGIAREAKKLYFSPAGIAKKVKKAYIGVNNKAALWYVRRPTGTSMASKTASAALSVARKAIMSGSIGNKYAVFCGGIGGTSDSISNATNVVDIYDATLTRSTTTIKSKKARGVGVSAQSGCFCVGGLTSDVTFTDPSYRFDRDLTKTEIPVTDTSHLLAVTYLFATAMGDGVFIAGGNDANGIARAKAALINSDLTVTPLSDLSAGRYEGATANINRRYAVCAGGYGASTTYANVDCYDIDGSRQTLTSLRTGRNRLAAAQQEDAVFITGGYANGFINQVDIYDVDLVRTNGTNMSVGRHLLAGGSFDFGCVFAGGFQTLDNNGASSYCDFYDIDHTKRSVSGLPSAKHGWPGAASVSNTFLVAGGANSYRNTITVQSTVSAFTYTEVF